MSTPIPIYLGVEDELSEWVVRRVLGERSPGYAIGAVFGRSGFGYLKRQALAFNNAAKGCPFLVLTDLDQAACPPLLVAEWLGDRPKHPRFLLRVAVREVESWLLADGRGLSRYLGLRQPAMVADPEGLADPKQELLRLAHSSPRKMLREAIAWYDEASGKYFQGPDYNGALAPFILKGWDMALASQRCRSLNRFIVALGRLETTYLSDGE